MKYVGNFSNWIEQEYIDYMLANNGTPRPGGGRNPVDPRFIALFNVFNLTPPTHGVLLSIYSSIINTFYREFPESVKTAATKITPSILRLYNFIIEKMPPTPSKFHYM